MEVAVAVPHLMVLAIHTMEQAVQAVAVAVVQQELQTPVAVAVAHQWLVVLVMCASDTGVHEPL
jgi:hypothetical protein